MPENLGRETNSVGAVGPETAKMLAAVAGDGTAKGVAGGGAILRHGAHVCGCGERWKCGKPESCRLPRKEPCFTCWMYK